MRVSVSRIILVEGDVNDTRFYPKEGKERGVARPIKFFESHLKTYGFLRVHRAFRINTNYVKAYNSEVLTMSNGQTDKEYFEGFDDLKMSCALEI